jgi:hypothetical protein
MIARQVSPASQASVTETSGVLMSFIAIFHHLGASDAMMTFGAIPLASINHRLADLCLISDEAGALPCS